MIDQSQADDPGLDPLVQRLAAERRRDLGLADQLQVDRQGAALQTSASSWASEMPLKPPEIWAPVRPSIPSGFSAKLMIGRVLTSLSRTTAKWPESASASSAPASPIACSWPRWAIRRVTSWKASRPESVKPKVTFGSWFSPNFSSGLVISVPGQRRVVLHRVPARFGAFDRAPLRSAAVRRRRRSRPAP